MSLSERSPIGEAHALRRLNKVGNANSVPLKPCLLWQY